MNYDPVNHPSHYTKGRKYEAIDVIEDAVKRAPDPILGALQWQCLKYILRLWDKQSPSLDAGKARWYLNRLIDKLDTDLKTESIQDEEIEEDTITIEKYMKQAIQELSYTDKQMEYDR